MDAYNFSKTIFLIMASPLAPYRGGTPRPPQECVLYKMSKKQPDDGIFYFAFFKKLLEFSKQVLNLIAT